MISNLADALAELERHGLVGAIQAGWLMVGTSISEQHPGIRVYENALAIQGQDGGWLLRTDGPGQTVNEARFENLEDAVGEAVVWVQALPTRG